MTNTNNNLTPGVYITEENAFPNSVIEVATAIPVFIGYTAMVEYKQQSSLGKPVKITSLANYETIFGKGPATAIQFSLKAASIILPVPAITPVLNINGKLHSVQMSSPVYYLYNCIRSFYENGGGDCYIVSVGNYTNPIQLSDFQTGLTTLQQEYEPTLLLIPDALSLHHDDYFTLVNDALMLCQKLQRLVAILDVYNGAATADPSVIGSGLSNDPVQDFRNNSGSNGLDYGVAYFPWIKTNVVQNGEITFLNLPDPLSYIESDSATQATFANINITYITPARAAVQADANYINPATSLAVAKAHNALTTLSANYKQIVIAATSIACVLPPSAAMAGLYNYVDDMQGVWKAPANISMNGVIAPTMNINDDVQAKLNVSIQDGKSINAIRSFPGQGVLVWGARTLDGNSQDWRYVNVRRTMIMIEQSVNLALRTYVFEPNTATTWITVQTIINNFLNNLWKQGSLAGSAPSDAYNVLLGLGSTMTADDILAGIMRITLLVAITHPAEFIEINFQQQMQKS